jgi:hypothetical protein
MRIAIIQPVGSRERGLGVENEKRHNSICGLKRKRPSELILQGP